MKTTIILPAAFLSLALLAGCGGDTYVRVEGTTTISKGQELTDLQRALGEGAISEAEYRELRERIMRRPN